jgi:CheY-like chemotaxis protein
MIEQIQPARLAAEFENAVPSLSYLTLMRQDHLERCLLAGELNGEIVASCTYRPGAGTKETIAKGDRAEQVSGVLTAYQQVCADPPDLIYLDMSVYAADAFLVAIGNRPGLRAIPVVAITAGSELPFHLRRQCISVRGDSSSDGTAESTWSRQGQAPPEFFSTPPHPENRIQYIEEAIQNPVHLSRRRCPVCSDHFNGKAG